MQIFLKNQRQWAGPALAEADVRAWKATQHATGIRLAFAHASYLINLATPVPTDWARAVSAFQDELERAEALGLPFVVIHPGSHRGGGRHLGVRQVVAAIDELTRRTRGYRVRIALENTAGAGDTVGATFEELGDLVARARMPERVGVCLDTCHLFAAGYDIRARAGYEAAMAKCAQRLGVATVCAFHLNDSKAGLGSGLDRHQHIGQGQLGRAAFRWLLSDPRWTRIPKVLETPKEPEPQADIRNLAVLRRLARPRA